MRKLQVAALPSQAAPSGEPSRLLTDWIAAYGDLTDRAELFLEGWRDGLKGRRVPKDVSDSMAAIRPMYGLKAEAVRTTSPPEANSKLDKTGAVGLTLQSARTVLACGCVVESCDRRGFCTHICVVDNGNGAYPVTQRARTAKTHWATHHPDHFLYRYGLELGRDFGKGLVGLNRPDVNTDQDWRRIFGGVWSDLPIVSYGYTKLKHVLYRSDGGHDGNYHQAYSLSERDRLGVPGVVETLQTFLDRGGNIAVVTNRKKDGEVKQFSELLGLSARVVDADKSDGWMIEHRGVLGCLSVKGKGRSFVGKTKFIREAY